MNNVSIMGRLTREPELSYIQGSNGQTAVTRFTVAVDKNLSKEKRQEMEGQNKPTADFISCVAWGKIAETISKYTAKGLRVIVEGRIETGSYEKDGIVRYTTDIRVSSIEFIDWKDNNQGQQGQNGGYQQQGGYNQGGYQQNGYQQPAQNMQNQYQQQRGYQPQPQQQQNNYNQGGYTPAPGGDESIPF